MAKLVERNAWSFNCFSEYWIPFLGQFFTDSSTCSLIYWAIQYRSSLKKFMSCNCETIKFNHYNWPTDKEKRRLCKHCSSHITNWNKSVKKLFKSEWFMSRIFVHFVLEEPRQEHSATHVVWERENCTILEPLSRKIILKGGKFKTTSSEVSEGQWTLKLNFLLMPKQIYHQSTIQSLARFFFIRNRKFWSSFVVLKFLHNLSLNCSFKNCSCFHYVSYHRKHVYNPNRVSICWRPATS